MTSLGIPFIVIVRIQCQITWMGDHSMKKGTPGFIVGFILGAMLFGGVAAYAAGIIANPTTSKILVNGQNVNVTAYNIEGRNYLQLRDMAAAVNFSVVWDGTNNRVLIDTGRKYDPNEQYVPETSTAPVASRPTSNSTKAGDVIKTTDGDYIITKGKPAEEALPAPNPESRMGGNLPRDCAAKSDADTVARHRRVWRLRSNDGF